MWNLFLDCVQFKSILLTVDILNAGGMMGGVCEQLIFSKVRDEEVREVRDLINQSYREQKLETFSENIIFPFKVSRI